MENRLGICVFYDNDGIVDDFICYFLEKLMPHLSQLCIVVNGNLNNEGKNKLEKYTKTIIIRENQGLDAYAYRCGLEYFGWEKLKNFNEVLMFNTTCFGPIYPFSELFERIKNKECDFWGLWRWSAPKNSSYVQGYHIPSFFYCYRNSLLKSDIFKEYWQTMPEIKNYNDAVIFHEQRQTPYFTQKGFKYNVCYNLDEYATDKEYWPATKENKYIKNERFPLIKRRSLFVNKNIFNVNNYLELINIIKTTDYNQNLIAQNIIRTQIIDNKNVIYRKINCIFKILLYILLFNKNKIKEYCNNYKKYITKKEFEKILFDCHLKNKKGLINTA